MAVDPLYENLKAPQFADPLVFEQDQEEFLDDSYFEYDHEAEGGPVRWKEAEDLEIGRTPDSVYSTPVTRSAASRLASAESDTPVSSASPQRPTASQVMEIESHSTEEKTDLNVLENVCTSVAEWQNKRPTRASPRQNKPATQPNNTTSNNNKSQGPMRVRRSVNPASQAAEPKGANIKRSRSLQGPRPDGGHVRKASSSLKRVPSIERGLRSDGHSASKIKAPVAPANKPEPVKRTNKSTGGTDSLKKTSEQIELERIEAMRLDLARKRKVSSQSLKLVQKSCGPMPVHSKQAPTRPEEFNLATATRVKNEQAPPNEVSCSDFAAMLRKAKNRSPKTRTGATVAKPFQFAERKRKHDEKEAKKYKTDAECLREFSTKTPTRFHSKPHDKGPSPCKKSRPELTKPRTPQLETRSRSRPVTVETQADKEAKELDEVLHHQFKARPVNERILSNPGVGVKKVPRKEPTKPEPFEFESDRFMHNKPNNTSGGKEEAPYKFRARPLNTAILQGPVGIKPACQVPLTEAQSPAFALRNRLHNHRRSHTQEKTEMDTRIIKAHHVPHSGIPFVPSLEHKVTQPKPFSFEARQQGMLRHKEEKIREKLEDEKKLRAFHAQPLPDTSPDSLPNVPKKPITVPEPFELECEIRGSSKASEWSQKQEEMLRQQRQQAMFKARPAAVLAKEPFLPEPSNRPLTDVTEVTLNTERRCDERTAWEADLQEEKAQQASIHKAQLQRQQQEEEEEVRRLRQSTVTRAQPIRNYKQVDIKPSDKPLTKCETPRFSERLKSRTGKC